MEEPIVTEVVEHAETPEERQFLDYIERPPESLQKYNHEIYRRHLEFAQDVFTENGINIVEKETAVKQLAEKLTEVELDGEVDGLTRILNRKGFERVLASALSTSQRTKQPLSLILFDLNNLKPVNDEQGHKAGDELLRKFSSVLSAHGRTTDALARIGGDEFALILPGFNIEEPNDYGSEIIEALIKNGLSASAGGSIIKLDNVEQSIKQADKRLYDAKAESKDKNNPNYGKSILIASNTVSQSESVQ